MSTWQWQSEMFLKIEERRGKERKGKERKGKERKGKERKGKERKGKERKGKERKGKERKGKEKCSLDEFYNRFGNFTHYELPSSIRARKIEISRNLIIQRH